MAKLPFPHYPGSAEAAADAAGKSTNQQATFTALQSNLSSQEDSAAQQASGDIEGSIAAAADAPKKDAGEAAGAALVGGGAVNHFASAIKTYNGHVDALNKEYEDAKADDFGVAADAGHAEGNTDAENETAHDGKVQAADTALQARLEKERQGYENDLDDAADFSAAMLIAGPTQSTILSLYITGDIDVDAAAAALGTTVGVLNNIRIATGTIRGIVGWKDTLPALTQWLLKKDLNKVTRGSMAAFQGQLKALVRENVGKQMSFAQRVQAYKNAKQIFRGKALVDAAKPGNLFGKYGYLPKHSTAPPGALRTAFGATGNVIGKALPFLSVAAGGYGLYDTYTNRENLTTAEEVNGYVGSGSTLLAGGIGAAAVLGATIPPVGAAIAIGAGVVALGSFAVDYFNWEDDIANAADATGDWLADRGSDIAEGVGDLAEGAGEVLDDITPW